MGPARLTGALLARKGDAAPVRGAYGGTILEPLPGLFGRGVLRAEPRTGADGGTAPGPSLSSRAAVRRVAAVAEALRSSATARTAPSVRPGEAARLSLRLDGDQLTRLRILAARRGRRPQQLLREALEAVFAGTADECPCVRGADEACCKDIPPDAAPA